MIISDKYKYVFMQTPMTGCSAIAKELIENYHGRPILSKHAVYSTFLSNASEEQKKYFVFSAVRNPLDKITSNYQKMVNNHNARFTQKLNKNPIKAIFQVRDRINFRKIQGGWTFEDYLKNMKIYDEVSTLDHHKFDFILHFETLSDDFKKVLNTLSVEPVRDLPAYNSTKDKPHYLSFYKSEEAKLQAIKKLGPFIEKSEYSFPPEWGEIHLTVWNRIKYAFWHKLRVISWRYLRKSIRGHEL